MVGDGGCRASEEIGEKERHGRLARLVLGSSDGDSGCPPDPLFVPGPDPKLLSHLGEGIHGLL